MRLYSFLLYVNKRFRLDMNFVKNSLFIYNNDNKRKELKKIGI